MSALTPYLLPAIFRSHQLKTKIGNIELNKLLVSSYGLRRCTLHPISRCSQHTSSSKSASETSPEDQKDSTKTSSATSGGDQSNTDLENLSSARKEIIELKDKYLRSVADFRNLQERTRRDIEQAKQFAISRFARDLVESVDNFDRALLNTRAIANPQAEKEMSHKEEKTALLEGLEMTEKILMATLKKHGVERFDPSANADKFDPNLHDAAFMAPQPDRVNDTVFETIQKGFLLNGRVLRAAKVGVVKNP